MSTGMTGPRHIGKYELRERVGRGGMAEVWKAWDTQLERYVAIKILHADLQHDPEYTKRLFAREARVVASLRHPNIVQVHDFQIATVAGSQEASQGNADANSIAYMVMDYVEGQTLADAIRSTSRQGKFPPAHDIIYLFTAIGSAIDYAHQRGMIHRDIKPANILLDQRNTTRSTMGEPILTDFGIVKLLGASTGTLSGSWLGTPLYISPEQAQGHTGNERSDIYSLGVVLYEICTGVRPFSGDNPLMIIMQHIHAEPTPPALINPKIPPALSEVILRSLAKDPIKRFPSASAMAAAIAQAFNSPAKPPSQSLSGIPLADAYTGYPYGTPGVTPAPPVTPGSKITPPPSSVFTTPQFPSPTTNTQGTSTEGTSGSSTPATPSGFTPPQHVGSATPVFPTSPATTSAASTPPFVPPTPGPTRGRPRRGLFVTLLAVLLLVLVSSGVGAFYLFTHQSSPPASHIVTGNALFLSSGQLNANTTQGLDDRLQLNLSNIPPPAAGKSYYAWLLSDANQNPTTSILLGKLTVSGGKANLPYPGDQQHTDLLGTYSRLLITEEDSSPTPQHFSTDQSMWRYHGELPQTPDPADGMRALDSIRNLLYENINKNGGLIAPFVQDTKATVQLSDSAKESWTKQDFQALHTQLISLLDYVDGSDFAHNDLPSGTPILLQVDTPLIRQKVGQVPTGFLERVDGELINLAAAPGISSETNKLATQADIALTNNVLPLLSRVRQYATQLAHMDDAHLAQPSTLAILNNLQAATHEAFNGQVDPITKQVQLVGLMQIDAMINNLLLFDVASYA